MKHLYLVLIFILLLSGCDNASDIQKSAIQIKEGEKCKSNQECQTIDCSIHDSAVKSGYIPECADEICKCMCWGCK